ncbi:MAG: ATP cone domain-containing protein [Candidatus Micrarchaeia archaeon]
MRLRVEKKNGKAEPFSLEKLFTSIIRAGGTVELAENVAGSVAHALNDSAKAGVVASADIKRRVSGILRKADKGVAGQYSKFKKPAEQAR